MKKFIVLLSIIVIFASSYVFAEVSMFGTESKHLKNIKQLTFGGENAEAYFSSDGKQLVFQSKRDGAEYDSIYIMDIDGNNVRKISSGEGATTCSFISPDGKSIIYGSTHLYGKDTIPRPDMSRGYVWPLYASYDIFKINISGCSFSLQRLTDTPGYDAEAVYSPDGTKIVFTSVRTGDLELFLMNPDGSNVEQLTSELGYDGGAFFSRDSKWIVWRASRPEGKELKDYESLLKDNLIRPSKLEVYIMNLEDRVPIQLTDNGAANFGPYFHPNGEKVIFVSNMENPRGHNFDLYMIDIRTREIERITYFEGFDGFPMFSYDGKRLVFASNRDNNVRGETNVFIADWVD